MPRHVTLVCGPPCAGKTIWVTGHAHPDDTVIDWDPDVTAWVLRPPANPLPD